MNYNSVLKDFLKNLGSCPKPPKLLLHSCCGPCSSYCLGFLMEYFDISVLFYNPNIFPEDEFRHRLNEQKKIIGKLNSVSCLEYNLNEKNISRKRICEIKLIEPEYDYSEFRRYVSGLEEQPEGGLRCRKCFELRLSKAAEVAREEGFDYFATTLSVSPHKDAVLLNEIGTALDGEKYLASDFKKEDGYKTSVILSKKFDLYRQNYCGCEYSMWFER